MLMKASSKVIATSFRVSEPSFALATNSFSGRTVKFSLSMMSRCFSNCVAEMLVIAGVVVST